MARSVGLAGEALGRRPGLAHDQEASPSCGDSAMRARTPSSARRASSARGLVGVGGEPDRDLDRDGRRADRVVAHDPAGQALVGDEQARVGAGAQPGVGQADVLDGPGLVLEGDEVADPHRLGDRQQDAGDRVGQRLARGEADDGGGDRAGGQDRAADAVQRVELRQRDRDDDDRDDGLDRAAGEAQAGRGVAREALVAGDHLGQLRRAADAGSGP